MLGRSWAQRSVAIALAFAVALLGLGAQPAYAALEGNKTFNGYAHDVKVYAASGTVDAGPVSAAGVGCSDRAPLFYSNGIADVSLAGVSLGTSTTTSQASKSGTVQTVTSTFQAANVALPLLGGLALRADAMTVTSVVNYDTATQTFTNSSSMNVTNLTVRNGLLPPIISLNGVVAPDQALINIPGVATIGFHRTQVLGSNADGALGKMATGVSVQLLGSTVSTVIGETYSAIYGSADQNFLFGAGEAVKVSTSDAALAVGPLLTAQVPCAGGGPVESSLPSVTLPGSLGSLGAVKSTAVGDRDGLLGSATTTSEAVGVNLAGGLVTADVVSSISRAETADGGQTVSTDGTASTFTNLRIAGVPVAVDTPFNTVIQLPTELGYVVVNARTDYDSGVETIPLVVHLNPVAGVPAVDIVVARSYAFVLGPNTSDAAVASARAMLEESDALEPVIEEELTEGELPETGVEPEGLDKGWIDEGPKIVKEQTQAGVTEMKEKLRSQISEMKDRFKALKDLAKKRQPQ